MENVITFAHNSIKRHISSHSYVIDATVGNGHDTVFLAKNAKHVYGFDIQEMAIKNTKKRVEDENLSNVTLFLDSHTNIAKYIKDPIDAVMFNLGYLPNGNKDITTKADTTIEAINKVLPLLNKKGLLTITIYIGHNEGISEQEALEAYFESLDSFLYTVIRYQHVNKKLAPYTVCIQKR